MNVLIIGVTGTIGSSLYSLLEEKSYQVYGTSSKIGGDNRILELDLEHLERIANFSVDFKIDHLIIASGIGPSRNLREATVEHFHKMMNVNLLGPMELIKTLLPFFNNNASITLISSPAADKGSYDPLYASVKGGTNSLVKTLAKELAPNIRVNAISPSLIIDSKVYKGMTEDFQLKHLNNTLTKRHTTAIECAELIEFLLQAKQITGQVIQLNGGMT